MSRFLKTDWRSTCAGLAMILSAVSRIHSPQDLTHADVFGALSGGVGLILCADRGKDTPRDARPPQ